MEESTARDDTALCFTGQEVPRLPDYFKKNCCSSSGEKNQGILQYFDTLQKGENGQAKADALLKLYNKKTRNLKITNALGDNRVRAGSMVVINLDLGDIKLKNWMLVEKCKHTYKEGEHWMDLTLRGGEFVA